MYRLNWVLNKWGRREIRWCEKIFFTSKDHSITQTWNGPDNHTEIEQSIKCNSSRWCEMFEKTILKMGGYWNHFTSSNVKHSWYFISFYKYYYKIQEKNKKNRFMKKKFLQNYSGTLCTLVILLVWYVYNLKLITWLHYIKY